jgi:hypothetical protein
MNVVHLKRTRVISTACSVLRFPSSMSYGETFPGGIWKRKVTGKKSLKIPPQIDGPISFS